MVRLLPVALLLLQIISVHTELVVVPVTVTDADGRHVNGLSQGEFHVYEDGRPQAITIFHHGDVPVTLGLIVDRSQSMREKTPELLGAVSAVLRASRPDDELFAVDFSDNVSFALPAPRTFTHDAKELKAMLAAARADGRTALYDGVAEGLQHLRLGRAERRALIVVSDGGDNASRRSYAEVLALARRSDAVIYAIGLLGTSMAREQENAGLLKRLCKDTGGIAYFPRTAAEIVTVSSEVARDLGAQYTIGFAPGGRTDGRAFRKIVVTVTAPGRGRLHVRTRSGYVAVDDGDARDELKERRR